MISKPPSENFSTLKHSEDCDAAITKGVLHALERSTIKMRQFW